jgi:hypothetical protein
MASTSRDRILRGALWATAGLNVLGAVIFGLPALGHASPLLPMAVPPYFAAQIGFTIALFAGVYAWLALQPTFHRPLIVVGGLGKLGFFALTAAYALAGEVPVGMALNATPDLVFAGIFLWWALQTEKFAAVGARVGGRSVGRR